MKIKRLDICGFKSFVDRTVLHFDHDITGVVGPNGCGKSNIVDAILWVMGEQSPKHLRGKAMDDVIFNGSESRGPGGFAEVTLTFDNTQGLAPADFRECSEIAVTRRLTRDGDSDYLINRTPVRLRDVTELFLGTGVGTKAYSIIEQGRIGLIVSSKPEDRRGIIEEAAGITKYKSRKKAAERKMDLTHQNLLRVTDIVGEIEKNLSTLQRQAQKAERYKRYRAEMRDLELHVASHRYLALVAERKVVAGSLSAVAATVEGLRYGLQVRDAEAEARRVRLHELERVVETRQHRAYELDNTVRVLDGKRTRDLERLGSVQERERAAERDLSESTTLRSQLAAERQALTEQLGSLEAAELEAGDREAVQQRVLDGHRAELGESDSLAGLARAALAELGSRIARAEATLESFARRRTDAQTRLEKLVAEREQLRERAAEVEDQLLTLHTELGALRSGVTTTASDRERLEQERVALRARLSGSDHVLEEVRREVAQRRSRLHSLEEIRARFEGVDIGVRAVMRKPPAGVVSLVAERVDAPAELTVALAAALGERLQAIVVDEVGSVQSILGRLREPGGGRATLMPRSPRRVVKPSAPIPRGDGIVGRLIDLVAFDEQDEGLVRHLLGDALVVEDLAAAIALWAGGTSEWRLVTRTGELVAADGAVTGGTAATVGTALLETKREIRSLERLVPTIESRLTAEIADRDEARHEMARVQGELEAARVAAHQGEIAAVRAEKDLRRAEDERDRIGRRHATVTTECEELERALSDTGEEELSATADLEDARGARVIAEQHVADSEALVREARERVDAAAQIATELRVMATQAREQAAGVRAGLARLARSLGDVQTRGERLAAEIAEGAVVQGQLAASLMETSEAIVDATAEAMQAHQHLAAARAGYDGAREDADREELALREIRGRIDASTKEETGLVVRERELDLALEHLVSGVKERHRTVLEAILGDYHARPLPDDSVHARIDELVRLVERMGEINLTAIAEYEEQSKRHGFLAAQKKDLEDALGQLSKAITKMNRESKRLFRETFDVVNDRFQKIFPQMFGGGRAHLVLTNPEDMLETGVDIVAMPPGKRLGRLELMSGGEKALTAVSLVFAVFQYRPSPFCLLDEVDAPLDEANIARFCEAVKTMTDRSQFIVITHSKRTMEEADVLVGVTMEEPGVSNLVSVELKARKKARASTAPPRAPESGDVAVA